MQAHKFSISLPQHQYDFLESYKQQHHFKSRSDVIKKALQLLNQAELEASYQAAEAEIENDFESCSLDGLNSNETW